MGLPIACIKFCVLYRVATMQHDGASVPVLANVDTHMRYPRGVSYVPVKKTKSPGCGLETRVEML